MTTMKQLFTVLVAAMFAASSFAALAQDKKASAKKGTGMEKKADAKNNSERKNHVGSQ